jgi:hypothetical protein
MREIIANASIASNKTRAGLSKEESARFFGPPPLIAGEDQAQYEAMRDQISAAVGPLDFLEEIWVNDVVNLVWEALRLRRLRAAQLQAAAPEGVYQILNRRVDPFTGEKIATDWAAREPDAVAKVDAALAAAGLTIDAVMAETLARKIDEVERIDRMVAGAEARRNIALREIDWHRATLGAALRQVADEVLDAEFKEIPPRLTEGQAA